MALTTKKQITLTGQSKVKSGDSEVVAQNFSATIVGGTVTSTSASLVNESAYNANVETCRADKDAFETWIRSVEDEMKAELATEAEA